MGRGDINPLILNFDWTLGGGEWSVSVISLEQPSLHIEYEAGWDPELVWTFTTKYLFPYWESNHNLSVVQPF